MAVKVVFYKFYMLPHENLGGSTAPPCPRAEGTRSTPKKFGTMGSTISPIKNYNNRRQALLADFLLKLFSKEFTKYL